MRAPVLIFAFSCLLCQPRLLGQERNIIDGVAAVVGEHVILKSDVAQLVQMTAVELRLDPGLDGKRLLKLQNDVIQNLINQKLILEIAEVESIEVAEREVETALDQYISSHVARLGSEERLEEALGKNINELRRESWSDVREQLIGERFRAELLKNISVTRNEVTAFYTLYKDSLGIIPTLYDLRHILFEVRPGGKSRRRAQALADSLRNRLLSGETFTPLARQFSNDPGSAPSGGELGLVGRGTFVQAFEEAAFSLNSGEISPIVTTLFGYHIIQLVNKLGEKINVRHILISPQASVADEDSIYALALSVRDSITSADDFSNMASVYSADENTRDGGGKLGWINPASLPVKEMSQVLSILDVGEVSPPVNASDGYHLMLISDVRVGGFPTPESHWIEIEQMALAKKKGDFFNSWIEGVSSAVFIKSYLE